MNRLTIVPSYLALVEVLILIVFTPPSSFDRPPNTSSRIGLTGDYNYDLDTDRPVLSASSEIAIEGKGHITLVCNGTNPNSIESYTFYKYERVKKKSTENIFVVGGNRSNNGIYSCTFMRHISGFSGVSNVISLRFLCK